MAVSEVSDVASPVVRVICGPTAAGKTQAAVECAALGDIVIVSADSRQLYRGFDIGTAKPAAAERARVAHYGIDILEPTERASAAWWADRADAWIREALRAGRIPVVVGGTGLYLRALFGELFHEPPLDPTRRALLQAYLDTLDLAALQRWVAVFDPARAHLGRTQLLRAIELAILTGRRMSDVHAEHRRPPRWRARYLVVDPGAALADRITQRAQEMFDSGWADEVAALMARVPAGAPAWNASGYGAVRDLVQGTTGGGREATMERVVIETRQYAKRQRTWFRHQLGAAPVTRLDPQAAGAGVDLARWFHDGGESVR